VAGQNSVTVSQGRCPFKCLKAACWDQLPDLVGIGRCPRKPGGVERFLGRVFSHRAAPPPPAGFSYLAKSAMRRSRWNWFPCEIEMFWMLAKSDGSSRRTLHDAFADCRRTAIGWTDCYQRFSYAEANERRRKGKSRMKKTKQARGPTVRDQTKRKASRPSCFEAPQTQ